MKNFHVNEIELWYDPRNEILPKMPYLKGEPEMSKFDSAFLCGAIRKFRPKKIAEVGIAGGGDYCDYITVYSYASIK